MGNQVIGKVFILYGTAKAIAPDGSVRVLAINSPIYADERVVTESDAGVSIQMDGPSFGQIDIGRMSDVLFDQDVYAATTPDSVNDSKVEAGDIEKALEGSGEIELEATAAGGAQGTGGSTLVQFGLDGSEGNVTSGAETIGFTVGTVEPLDAIVNGTIEIPVIEPPILEPPVSNIWNDNNNNSMFDESDNQPQSIVIDFNHIDNDPGTGFVFIGDLLKEGKAITPSQVASNPPAETIMNVTHDVTFTFMNEGAGYHNTVGWYDVNHPEVGHVVWDNASANGSGGSLVPGVSTVTIPNVPEGTQLGFFMIPDAHSFDQSIPDTVYFHDGKAYTNETYTNLIHSNDNSQCGYDNPVWFSNTVNVDHLQHAITGVAEGEANTLYVGFEDLGGGGDKDYNDVVFKVYLGEGNEIQINPIVFNVGADVLDQDGSMLSSAQLTFDLGDGDVVNYTPVDDLTVTHIGDTFNIEGVADVSIYNQLLNSFTITVGNSGINEGFDIDMSSRQATLTVTDVDNLISDDSIATFELVWADTCMDSVLPPVDDYIA
jgi:hypothetical protein